MASSIEVRALAPEELAEAWRIGRLAFGLPREPSPRSLEPQEGLTRYGAFDAAGRLVGKATDLHHHQWWGGVAVAAADVGGVAVIPEARGKGVARALLRHVLEQARDRGAVVSALYPSVAAVYRSFGWAAVGARRTFDVPTAQLIDTRLPPLLEVRPGAPKDLPLVFSAYNDMARLRNGMLALEPPSDPSMVLDGLDGLSVTMEGDRVVGYLSYNRGVGQRQDPPLTVEEIVAHTPQACASLLALLSSWRSVAATVRFTSLASGLLQQAIPLERASIHRSELFMQRPVDVSALVAARPFPESLECRLVLSIEDRFAPWNNGDFALEIAGGKGSLTPVHDRGTVGLRVEGLSLLTCGVASPWTLAEAGLAEASNPEELAPLAALAATPPVELLHYF